MGEAQRLAAAHAGDDLDWSEEQARSAANRWFADDDNRFDLDGIHGFLDVLSDFARAGFSPDEIGTWLAVTGEPTIAHFYAELGFTAQEALAAAPFLKHAPQGRPDVGRAWAEWQSFLASMPPSFVAKAGLAGVATPSDLRLIYAEYEVNPEQVNLQLDVLAGLQ